MIRPFLGCVPCYFEGDQSQGVEIRVKDSSDMLGQQSNFSFILFCSCFEEFIKYRPKIYKISIPKYIADFEEDFENINSLIKRSKNIKLIHKISRNYIQLF